MTKGSRDIEDREEAPGGIHMARGIEGEDESQSED